MPLQITLNKKVLAYPATVRAELFLSVFNVDIMFLAPVGLPHKFPPAVSPYLHHTDAA